MSAAVAVQMTLADVLKLRKKRSTIIWALVLAVAPLLIYFAVKIGQHASAPARYAPAGGLHAFEGATGFLAMFFGPLAAILIGVEAGAGDHAAGVFRDLVVTGRSRLALFATRVPAALAVCWAVMATAFAVALIGAFAFASSLPTPGVGLIFEGLGFVALETGVICAISVGFASLVASKPAAIIAVIAWQLIASPLIANIESIGSVRDGVLSQALAHFSPVHAGGHGISVTMAGGTAAIVIVLWLAVMLALGAWRTRTMDA